MSGKEEVYKILKAELGAVRIDEVLSSYTTLQIGGPADYFFEAYSYEEITKAVTIALKLEIPYFILGGGSNILILDKGFRGLVIRNKSKKIKILGYRGKVIKDSTLDSIPLQSKLEVETVLIEAESGVPFNRLVRFCIEEGLGGLEEFLGLPGTVGGAVVANAHWQNLHVGDLVVSKQSLGEKVLLSAVFGLKKTDRDILWRKAHEAVAYRLKTQPSSYHSAGCIFKNIKKSEALRISTPGLTTSAGFLIEAANLKGKQIGKVQISPVHANFIINLGGGKAADVLDLISLIKESVSEKFKVNLVEEIIQIREF